MNLLPNLRVMTIIANKWRMVRNDVESVIKEFVRRQTHYVLLDEYRSSPATTWDELFHQPSLVARWSSNASLRDFLVNCTGNIERSLDTQLDLRDTATLRESRERRTSKITLLLRLTKRFVAPTFVWSSPVVQFGLSYMAILGVVDATQDRVHVKAAGLDLLARLTAHSIGPSTPLGDSDEEDGVDEEAVQECAGRGGWVMRWVCVVVVFVNHSRHRQLRQRPIVATRVALVYTKTSEM
jgi:hypothetical protein